MVSSESIRDRQIVFALLSQRVLYLLCSCHLVCSSVGLMLAARNVNNNCYNNDVSCALQMRDMNHENVNHFIGLCTEKPNVSIAMVYCTRRSIMVMQQHRINNLLFIVTCIRASVKLSVGQPQGVMQFKGAV